MQLNGCLGPIVGPSEHDLPYINRIDNAFGFLSLFSRERWS
jgi:hypothetical protein